MKNQYVGDIGDFGKYSLLRAFSKAGVTIGVNWYLTDNDGSNDGKFTKYLHEGSLRYLEPVVFDVLQPLAERKDKTVQDISRSNLLAGAVFFDEPLRPEGNPAERKAQRAQWFEKSLEVLAGTQLIFLDPDNGLLVSDDASKLNAEKYVLPSEVEAYYNEGHDVVYYCHKGRRNYVDWDDYKSFMSERLPKTKPIVLTYRKGTQRSYIFLVHEDIFVRYRRILESFLTSWHRLYVEESIHNVSVNYYRQAGCYFESYDRQEVYEYIMTQVAAHGSSKITLKFANAADYQQAYAEIMTMEYLQKLANDLSRRYGITISHRTGTAGDTSHRLELVFS